MLDARLCPAAQFEAAAFDLVVDKGGLDALMGEDTPDAAAAGQKLLAEVGRLAAGAGGTYACVTLAQAHVLRALPLAGHRVPCNSDRVPIARARVYFLGRCWAICCLRRRAVGSQRRRPVRLPGLGAGPIESVAFDHLGMHV